jgi:antitoxin ParD1/3/4
MDFELPPSLCPLIRTNTSTTANATSSAHQKCCFDPVSIESDLVDRLVLSGRYQNASEVLREGLRLIESQEADAKARIKALRDAARLGIADMDAGQYRTFESSASLNQHLSELSDKILVDKGLRKRRK